MNANLRWVVLAGLLAGATAGGGACGGAGAGGGVRDSGADARGPDVADGGADVPRRDTADAVPADGALADAAFADAVDAAGLEAVDAARADAVDAAVAEAVDVAIADAVDVAGADADAADAPGGDVAEACCDGPAVCGAGARCYLPPGGGSGRCRAAPAAGACWDDSDCRPGELCDGAPACPCPGACPAPDLPGTCTCPLPATYVGCCYDDADCAAGERCYRERCAEGGMGLCHAPSPDAGACWDASDCGAGETCSGARVCACGDRCALPDAPGVCTGCVPQCADRVCGWDPFCNGSCGRCATGPCDDAGRCVDECESDCGARVCGPDPVCGRSCGTCTSGGCDRSGQCVACDVLSPRWARTLVGPGIALRRVAVAPTPDCGFLLAGGSTVEVNSDVWLLKLDAAGAPEWERLLGGVPDDFATAAIATADGLVVGARSHTWSVGADDNWLIALGPGGDVLGQRSLGGDSTDFPAAVAAAPGGGLVVAATSSSFGVGLRPWIAKILPTGAVPWQRAFDGAAGNASFTDVQPLAGGGFVAVGCWPLPGSESDDFLVVRLDADGLVVWQKTFDRSSYDCATAVTVLPGDGIVVAGDSGDIGTDGWAIRLDADGGIVWQKAFVGPGDARLFAAAADGLGVVLAGMFVYGDPRFQDGWAVRLDGRGGVTWQRTYGHGAATYEAFHRVLVLPDAGLLLAGADGDGLWLLRAGSDGLVPGDCGFYASEDTGIAVTDTSAEAVDGTAAVRDTDVVPGTPTSAARPADDSAAIDECVLP